VTPVPPQPSPPPSSSPAASPAAVAQKSTAGDQSQVSQSDAAPRKSASGGLTLILLLLAALFVVLGATVVVVLLITQRNLPGTGPAGSNRAGGNRTNDGDHRIAQERAEAAWADAVGKSLEIDRASIKIDRAEWGLVRGRDSHGQIITSDDPYLSIIVTIRNHSRSPFLYQSWHSGPHPAVLMDETNREFGRFQVPRFKAIEWHIPDERLERGQRSADRLVFAIPTDVKHDSVAAFRLELPAEAVERQGVFRFRIPVEMIEGF
jgi:hypothetical protein